MQKSVLRLSSAIPPSAFDLVASMQVGKVFKTDVYKESIIPTMKFQDSLPRLPIPKLQQTCERYVDSVTALLTPDQLANTKKIVSAFEANEGPRLDANLRKMDSANSHTSFLSKWWFEEYLKMRSPLVLNMNPYLVLRDHPVPAKMDPAIRAASFIMASVKIRHLLDSERLEPEIFHFDPVPLVTKPWFQKMVALCPRKFVTIPYILAGKTQSFPLDMTQFVNLFNSTRIPKRDLDVIRKGAGDHVAVLYRGHVFKVNAVESNGKPVSEAQLTARLHAILAVGAPQTNTHPVCVLTSAPRDDWADARAELERNPTNAASLKVIDDAIMVICLDDQTATIHEPASMGHQFLHNKGADRWWDKSFQLMFAGNGRAGMSFEHAWGDGVAVLRFAIDAFNATCADISVPAVENATEPLTRLQWELSDSSKASIEAATARINEETSRLKLHVGLFSKFGKKYLGKIGARADPFMQVAIQLAYWRIHRATHSTYESASTSAFRRGRTECIRGATVQSAAFTAAMDSPDVSIAEKATLLNAAIAKHMSLAKNAKMGQGADRHLYALKKMATEEGLSPALYSDPAYDTMKADMLSTSSLFSDALLLGGFGPVSAGYGIGYAAADDLALFHVTSWNHSCSDLADQVGRAMEDMVDIIVKTKGEGKKKN